MCPISPTQFVKSGIGMSFILDAHKVAPQTIYYIVRQEEYLLTLKTGCKISYFPQNVTSFIIYFVTSNAIPVFCKVLKFKYGPQCADPIISMYSPSFHG